MAQDLTRCVGLLRGVNVGGGNKVPMADLRALCAGLGWRDVRSYIASGNLVFRATGSPDALSLALRQAMARDMGVDVPILILDAASFHAARASCPFPADAGKAVHGVFCAATPVIDHALARSLGTAGEVLEVRDRMVWLHAPQGFGTSKLADRIDRVITGTSFTARNLNTIHTLAEMLDSLP